MTARQQKPKKARPGRRAEARQRKAARRRRTLLFSVATLAIAAGLVLVVVISRRGAPDAATIPSGVQTFAVPERFHVAGAVPYPQQPPAGGNHAPVWQNCGFYDEPISNERAVHSLEHGAVWLTYRPNVPGAQIEALRGRARQTFVLVSPFSGLPAPIVLSAWGRQLRLQSADDPRLDQFIRAFRVGPQTPEPGAPCTGGVGEPK